MECGLDTHGLMPALELGGLELFSANDVDVHDSFCGTTCEPLINVESNGPISERTTELNNVHERNSSVELPGYQTPSSFSRQKRSTFRADLLDKDGLPAAADLCQGYRILKELMSMANKAFNQPFLDLPNKEENPDYYQVTKKAICLTQMQEKFEINHYTSITEFVRDFRDMLENEMRYHGPDHPTARKAHKFDIMMEQKLALLSKELRELTSIEATHGRREEYLTDPTMLGRPRTRQSAPSNFTAELLNRLRTEGKSKEKELRKQQIADRQKEKETLVQEMMDWEMGLYKGTEREQVLSMWELPQIGLMFYLCQEPLNCGELPQFEIERCLLIPKASVALHLIMTSLLSSPYQRQYLDRRPPMPYEVWSEKLSRKLDSWYKVLSECGNSHTRAADSLGIEPMFWSVCGRIRNPLLKTSFHELTFYQRVWIVKSLCDHCMHTQSAMREVIDSQAAEDAREYVLGTDSDGVTYIHFPQFCGNDLRVYRLLPSTNKAVQHDKAAALHAMKTGKDKRDMVLEQNACGTPIIPQSPVDVGSSDTPTKTTSTGPSARALRLARRAAVFSDCLPNSTPHSGRKKRSKPASPPVQCSTTDGMEKEAEQISQIKETSRFPCGGEGDGCRSFADHKRAMPSKPLAKRSRSSLGRPAAEVDGEELDVRKICEPSSLQSLEHTGTECNITGTLDAAGLKSLPTEHIVSEKYLVNSAAVRLDRNDDPVCAESTGSPDLRCSMKLEMDVSADVGQHSIPVRRTPMGDVLDIAQPACVVTERDAAEHQGTLTTIHSTNADIELTKLEAGEQAPKKEMEATPEVEVEEVDLIKEPSDLHTFKLICDSVESLRGLIAKLATGPHKGDDTLHDKLSLLLQELEPWETKLQQLHVKAIGKIKKEVEEYVEPEVKVKGASVWDTDDESESLEEGNHSEEPTGSEQMEPEEEPSSARKSSRKRRTPAHLEEEVMPEEADMGVSVFGRQRKRRLIPNNIENPGIKKRDSIPTTLESATDTETKRSDSGKQQSITNSSKVKVHKMPAANTASELPSLISGPENKMKDTKTPAEKTEPTKPPVTQPQSGFSLVRINKQMYLIPTLQLSALLNQPGAKNVVQVVNKSVSVANNAVLSQRVQTSSSNQLLSNQAPSSNAISPGNHVLISNQEPAGTTTPGKLTFVTMPKTKSNFITTSAAQVATNGLSGSISSNAATVLHQKPISSEQTDTTLSANTAQSQPAPSKTGLEQVSSAVSSHQLTRFVIPGNSSATGSSLKTITLSNQPISLSNQPVTRFIYGLGNSATHVTTTDVRPKMVINSSMVHKVVRPQAAEVAGKPMQHKEVNAALVNKHSLPRLNLQTDQGLSLLTQLQPKTSKYSNGVTVKRLLQQQCSPGKTSPGANVSLVSENTISSAEATLVSKKAASNSMTVTPTSALSASTSTGCSLTVPASTSQTISTPLEVLPVCVRNATPICAEAITVAAKTSINLSQATCDTQPNTKSSAICGSNSTIGTSSVSTSTSSPSKAAADSLIRSVPTLGKASGYLLNVVPQQQRSVNSLMMATRQPSASILPGATLTSPVRLVKTVHTRPVGGSPTKSLRFNVPVNQSIKLSDNKLAGQQIVLVNAANQTQAPTGVQSSNQHQLLLYNINGQLFMPQRMQSVVTGASTAVSANVPDVARNAVEPVIKYQLTLPQHTVSQTGPTQKIVLEAGPAQKAVLHSVSPQKVEPVINAQSSPESNGVTDTLLQQNGF